MSVVPGTVSEWETFAKRHGVYGKSIRDFDRVSSASKMEEAAFLSLKILWPLRDSKQFNAKLLGLTSQQVGVAEKHLAGSRAWNAYLNHIDSKGSTRLLWENCLTWVRLPWRDTTIFAFETMIL